MGETWGIREGDYADRGILISFYVLEYKCTYLYLLIILGVSLHIPLT